MAEVWLIGPSPRYDHGILGDAIEASGLRVVLRDGKVLEYALDEDSVFEDLMSRIADLDGDGRDEVIVVRPYLDAGAALAVFGVAEGRLVEEAAARGFSNHAIGSRALGLSAILDVDGDGSDDILVPANGRKTLRIVSFREGTFRELGAIAHPVAIVSDFKIADRDGNGRLDVIYGLADGTLVVLNR